MTTQKMIVVLACMGMAVVGGLLYLAMVGNVWAVGILFSSWTILSWLGGFGCAFLLIRHLTEKEQQAFIANAKENTAIMLGMQTVQNKQNQTLMQQLSTAARLPQAAPPIGDALMIEDGIFSELSE